MNNNLMVYRRNKEILIEVMVQYMYIGFMRFDKLVYTVKIASDKMIYNKVKLGIVCVTFVIIIPSLSSNRCGR